MKNAKSLEALHTHTHTHTHIYIYNNIKLYIKYEKIQINMLLKHRQAVF